MIPMRFSPLLMEFRRNPFLAMERTVFDAQWDEVRANMRAGVQVEFDPKTLASLRFFSADGQVSSVVPCANLSEMQEALKADGGNGEQPQGNGNKTPDDDTFVCVICIHGTMTRDGDACTYGSRSHKKMMCQAASDSRCRGIVLHINSGGGEASVMPDYRDAINFALDRGINVTAVIEDMADSAALFTACITNRIFVTHGSDEVGSLGMFAVFTTTADGTILPMTNEVLHVRYAAQSKDKNFAFREASVGNMKPIDTMLREHLDTLLACVTKDRPSLTEEQLTGKVYRAKDVMGSMVDEVGDIAEATRWLMDEWEARQGAALPRHEAATDEEVAARAAITNQSMQDEPAEEPDSKPADQPAAASEEPADEPADEPTEEPTDEPQNEPQDEPNDAPQDEPAEDPDEETRCNPDNEHDAGQQSTSTNPQTANPAMYNHIAQAAGVETIEHTEDGLMLNTPLADTLEQHLAHQAEEVEQLNARHAEEVNTLNDRITQMEQTSSATVSTANETIAQLQASLAEREATIASLNGSVAQLTQQLVEATTARDEATADARQNGEQLQAAQGRISDLQAEVERLNAAQGQQPAAGQQPVSNGRADAAFSIRTQCNYNPAMSAAEYAAMKRKKA